MCGDKHRERHREAHTEREREREREREAKAPMLTFRCRQLKFAVCGDAFLRT